MNYSSIYRSIKYIYKSTHVYSKHADQLRKHGPILVKLSSLDSRECWRI